MATITKRGDTYRIRVSCGYDTKGKQVIRSTTWTPEPDMTPRQVEKEIQRQAVLFEEKCSGQGWGGNIKFEAFAKQWLKEYAEPNLKARTVDRAHQLEARVYKAMGHLRLDKITARHIQSFVNNLGEEGINQHTGGKLSPKTIKNYLSFISSVMGYAVRMGMLTVNPCSRVALPSGGRQERECYTVDEAQHFLESLQEAPLKYQAFYVLAMYSGFRRGELLGLEWSDIDFENRVITVNRTSLYTKGKGIFTDTPKTAGSRRALKLPAAVFDVLKKHRADQTQTRLSLGDQWKDSDRLFVNWDGDAMHPNTPYQWLERFCESTGQRFLGVHQFRHLNATLLINCGVDVKTVSASLGHTQVSTTMNIYAHTFAESQARAGEAVADALTISTKKRDKGTA